MRRHRFSNTAGFELDYELKESICKFMEACISTDKVSDAPCHHAIYKLLDHLPFSGPASFHDNY